MQDIFVHIYIHIYIYIYKSQNKQKLVYKNVKDLFIKLQVI